MPTGDRQDPAAFEFLAAMVSPFHPSSPPAPSEAGWAELMALAQRHRVVPALVEGLRRARIATPQLHADAMLAQCRAIALEELAHAVSAQAICAALEAEGLAYALLKGVALSSQIHGRLGLRSSRDIDLLVTPERAPEALQILAGQGFVPAQDGAPARKGQFERLMRSNKDIELFHDTRRQVVELHWRLFDNSRLLRDVTAEQAEPTSLVTGWECRVLPQEANLRYLALHGCQHGWSRLKWLVDFAAVLQRSDGPSQRRLFETSSDLDGRRAIGQAIVLGADHLGLPVDPALRSLILSDRRTEWLVRIARRCMIDGGPVELEARRFGSTLKNIGHYLISSAPSYLAAEAFYDMSNVSALPAGSRWRRFGAAGRVAHWLGRHVGARQP